MHCDARSRHDQQSERAELFFNPPFMLTCMILDEALHAYMHVCRPAASWGQCSRDIAKLRLEPAAFVMVVTDSQLQ